MDHETILKVSVNNLGIAVTVEHDDHIIASIQVDDIPDGPDAAATARAARELLTFIATEIAQRYGLNKLIRAQSDNPFEI